MNRFNPNTAHSTVIEAVREDGYAIVEDLLDTARLSQLRSEIQGHLDAVVPDGGDAFMGGLTKRFGRLLLTVPSSHTLVLHPSVTNVLDATLGLYGPTYQIHFTGVMHVMAGEKAQVLHRDAVPFPNPAPTVVIATMWAMNDFTRANGATVFVPGSHKWPEERAPQRDELRVAEMPAGSILIYAGNLIHGAGRCDSGDRTGVSIQYNMGWLRQEENQYLAVPLEVARTFPEPLQRIMGYDLADRHWGYVDQQHPLDFLNGERRVGTLDPPGCSLSAKRRIEGRDVGARPDHYYKVTLDD